MIALRLIGPDGATIAQTRSVLMDLLRALGGEPGRDAFGSWPENRIYLWKEKPDGSWDTVRNLKRADVSTTIMARKRTIECGDPQEDGTGSDPVERGVTVDILFAPVNGRGDAIARRLRALMKVGLFDLIVETDEELSAKMLAKFPGKKRRVRRHSVTGIGMVTPELPAMVWCGEA